MKSASTLSKFFLLTFCAGSLTVMGCGGTAGTPAEQFKAGMMEMSKDMIEIAESIKTVEDAEKSESKMADAMDKMVETLTKLSESLKTASDQEKQDFQKAMDDPELKASMDKAQAAITKLKSEHPDAAAKMEEINKKHGEKLQAAFMGIMTAMMQGQMGGAPGGAPDQGQSGAPTEGQSGTADQGGAPPEGQSGAADQGKGGADTTK